MRKCYIVFEWFTDVRCPNTISFVDSDGKRKNKGCKYSVRSSRIVRLVTTDKELAIRLTKNRPDLSYQEETLWTNL